MPSPVHTVRSYGSLTAVQRIFGRRGYLPARTGARAGTRIREQPFPDQPPTWRGTFPEWAVFWAHLFLRLKEGEDFEYVPRLSRVMGNVKGVQVDFMEYDVNVAIDIQGVFWHYGFSAAKQFNDTQTRERVEGIGLIYVAIDEDDAIRDPVYYLREARLGQDYSRAARGVV